MLEFIRKSFSKLFEILLWLVLIGSALSGLISGAMLPGGWKIIGIPGGLLLGAIIGFLIAIIWGGIISMIINIDQNLDKLVNGGKAKDANTQEVNNTNTTENQESAPVVASES